MKQSLAMFPGQGSQYVGMGKELIEHFPYTNEVFEEAEDAISVNLKRLCLEGPESDLALTANTQPTILTVSVAAWRVLVSETDFSCKYFAGHSLGEYSALVAAKKLNFTDAVRLVRRRGEAMQKAVPVGEGAMAAVMKVEADDLERRCNDVSTSEHQVSIANYNSPQQLVVAGHSQAVDRLVDLLKGEGKRAVKLNVSAPFHSKLMSPAKRAMEDQLQGTSFFPNDRILFPNLTASATSEYQADHLIDQIDHPVLWMQTIENAQELGILNFVEVGPSTVLTGLLRRCKLRDETEYLHTDDMRDAISKVTANA